MSLLTYFREPPYSEHRMQMEMIEFIKDRIYKHSVKDPGHFHKHMKEVKPEKILSEVTIPLIGRRSDIVVAFSKRKIINIECKLKDFAGVIKQATDHLTWCDYSYICVPMENSFIRKHEFKICLDLGIGVLFYMESVGFVEVLKAYHNSGKDKDLRKLMNQKIFD